MHNTSAHRGIQYNSHKLFQFIASYEKYSDTISRRQSHKTTIAAPLIFNATQLAELRKPMHVCSVVSCFGQLCYKSS